MARAARGGADDLEVGDVVKAMSPEDEQWYPGTIESANDDGTFTVKWDDPDGGPETEAVGLDSIKKVFIFKDYVVGDDVKAASPEDGRYYPGSVSKVIGDGTFEVTWDDPDGGPESNSVKPADMKKVVIFKDYKVDDKVEAVFPEDGNMYAATVVKANADGTFTVKWEDPDGGEEESAVGPKQMRYPPIPLDSLEIGSKHVGTVRSITGFGAFVSIGAEVDGLVHIGAITPDRVEDVNDYLEVGQEVDVWVTRVTDEGKLGLTMLEGRLGGGPRAPADLTPFADASPTDWHTGTVQGIMSFGCFVDVTLPDGATATGMVHISQLKDGFVENVEDEVEVGQEVKVRIESVDMDRGRMGLSMREDGGARGMPSGPVDVSAFESVASSEWIVGKVARTAPFGAFVTVTSPDGTATANGLVHITKIKDGFVESVEDELEVGQEVQVRVENVDTAEGKLSLSMKPEDEF